MNGNLLSGIFTDIVLKMASTTTTTTTNIYAVHISYEFLIVEFMS